MARRDKRVLSPRADSQVNLGTPISGAWEGRGFGRHFVFRYECPQGHVVRVNCSAWRGKHPEPATGAIRCPQCDRVQSSPDDDPEWNDAVRGA